MPLTKDQIADALRRTNIVGGSGFKIRPCENRDVFVVRGRFDLHRVAEILNEELDGLGS